MRIAGKTSIDDLKKGDFNDLIYNEIPAGEEWKIRLAEELIGMKNGIMDVKILTSDEIKDVTYSAPQMKKIARRQQQQQQQQEQEQMAGGRRGPNRGGRQSNDDSEGIATFIALTKTKGNVAADEELS